MLRTNAKDVIRDARLRKGLTQTELATEARIGFRTLQRIEDGTAEPRELTVYALAQALGLEPTDLLAERSA